MTTRKPGGRQHHDGEPLSLWLTSTIVRKAENTFNLVETAERRQQDLIAERGVSAAGRQSLINLIDLAHRIACYRVPAAAVPG